MCEGKFLVRTKVVDNVIREVVVTDFRFGVCVSRKPEGIWICQDLNKFYSKKNKQLKRFSSSAADNNSTIGASSNSFIQHNNNNNNSNPSLTTSTTVTTTTPLLQSKNSREADELVVAQRDSSPTFASPPSSSCVVDVIDVIHEEKEKDRGKEDEKESCNKNNTKSWINTTNTNNNNKEEKRPTQTIEIWDGIENNNVDNYNAINKKYHDVVSHHFNDIFYRNSSNSSDKYNTTTAQQLGTTVPTSTDHFQRQNPFSHYNNYLPRIEAAENPINLVVNKQKQQHQQQTKAKSASCASQSTSILYRHLNTHNNSISRSHNNFNDNRTNTHNLFNKASIPGVNYSRNQYVPVLSPLPPHGIRIRPTITAATTSGATKGSRVCHNYNERNGIPNGNGKLVTKQPKFNHNNKSHFTPLYPNPNPRNCQKNYNTKNNDSSAYLTKFFGNSPLLKLQLLNLLVVPTTGHHHNNHNQHRQQLLLNSSPATITAASTPDLIHISRLKTMLFDDDGGEKSGAAVVSAGAGEQPEQQITNNNNNNRRSDIEFDEVSKAKRVKLEKCEDEDDLVIDESAVDGVEEEDMSESSNESNNLLEAPSSPTITITATTTLNNDLLEHQNTNSSSSSSNSNDDKINNTAGPSSITEKRPSSTSSAPTEPIPPHTNKTQQVNNSNVTNNGHDSKVSQVPTPSAGKTSKSNPSKKYSNNTNSFDDNTNASSSSSLNSADNSNASTSMENKVIQLEKEILSLSSLLKTKEKEWNAILRLKKLKELTLEIYRRQKEVSALNNSHHPQVEDFTALLTKINSEREEIGVGENETRLNLEKTEKEIKGQEARIKACKIQDDEDGGDDNATTNKPVNDSSGASAEQFKASLALQQLCERNRSSLNQSSSPIPINNSASLLQNNKVIGEGRQGPIVEVRSIIADYRSKNQEETPTAKSSQSQQQETPKVKKSSFRKGTSSSSSTNNVVSIMQQNQNVSFKDVLVGLAQLSQTEKLGATATTHENVTTNARSIPKSNKDNNNSNSISTMQQVNAFINPSGTSSPSSSRQLGTTLAKLLSSNSSISVPGNTSHIDDVGTLTSINKRDTERENNSLSLANLLASSSKGRDEEMKEDDDLAPVCQGCNTNRAQFVCAGCANQWYCSRECQINAWDDHSEICSG